MKYLLFVCCWLGAMEIYAQRWLFTPLAYASRSFLYYGEQNTFIIPHHPDAVVDYTGTVIQAPPFTDSLPPVRLLSSHAKLVLFEEHNVFVITPHALEPVRFICHRDTLTFPVVHLTYDRATLRIEPPQSVVTPLKKHYTLPDGSIIIEQFNAFQEIFFRAKDFKRAINEKHRLSFHLFILAYKNAMLGNQYERGLYVDSIEVYIRNKKQQIVKKDKLEVKYGYSKSLMEVIDKKFVIRGYTMEIVCTTVFLNYKTKRYKMYQYYHDDKYASNHSYQEINNPLHLNRWEDWDKGFIQEIPWSKEPIRISYGIPAVFSIRFY
jgi:hypothetical protein